MEASKIVRAIPEDTGFTVFGADGPQPAKPRQVEKDKFDDDDDVALAFEDIEKHLKEQDENIALNFG